MIKIVLIASFGLFLLSGCGNNAQKMIEISTSPVQKPELTVPNADQLNLRDVRWVVITKDNFQEKTQELFRNGEPVVFFALTDEGYENISMNFSSIRAFIQQQKAIIVAYENYYKNANEALDKANANIDGAREQVEAQQDIEQPSVLDRLNPFK